MAVFFFGIYFKFRIAFILAHTKTIKALNAESSCRKVVVVVGVAFIPAIVNAAAGKSPQFSIFGVIDDETSYSERAAYGSDQSTDVYSPYSVYSNVGADFFVKNRDAAFVAKKKAVLAETKNLFRHRRYFVSVYMSNLESHCYRNTLRGIY